MDIQVGKNGGYPPGWDPSIMQSNKYDATNASPAVQKPTNSGNPPSPSPPPPKTPETSPQGSQEGGDHTQCPHCSGETLVTKVGRTLSHISGWIQKCFSIKIPTGVLKYIQDHTPVSKTAALKGPCKSCGGKGSIKSPAKIAAPAAEKVKANFQKNAEEITKLENKLAPHGGNRYTVIQGSETVEVGLGFNDAPSYTVIEGAGRRNKRLVAHSDLSSKGAPMFFEGAESNYIQGINSLASPGGHYFLKCSNKFSVAAGAQGVDITTGGPITISGGITRISGPEISITTQTGPLTLEGEVVNINGKSVEVATSDGDFCVRGNISAGTNVRVAGGLHTQNLSFVHGSCVGYNSFTDNATPKAIVSGKAVYGSAGVKGQIAAALDLAAHAAGIIADPTDVKNAIGPAAIFDLMDKMLTLAYLNLPQELSLTGYILPGTPVTFFDIVAPNATIGAAPGVVVTGPIIIGPGELTIGPTPVPLFNFPHVHIIPSLPHCHSVRLPAIDFSADTSEQLLAKQASIAYPTPQHTSSSLTELFKTTILLPGSIVVGTIIGRINDLIRGL
jgi:hypothetical protein